MSQVPENKENQPNPENPSNITEERKEGPLEPQGSVPKPKPKYINISRSEYYPLGQYDQEDEEHVLPLKTAGLLGLGHVDLSDMKYERLKIHTEGVPSEIVNRMVTFY